jgi:perosamine synthetase
MGQALSRRRFLGAVAGGAAIAGTGQSSAGARVPSSAGQPAALGGTPVRSAPFPSWPVHDITEEQAVIDVVRNGRWNRGPQVERFESQYAQLTGAVHCLATANGTSALLATLGALDVGPGDEVIVPPYTFVATVNAVLLRHALPVFVDTDVETFQIDARKVSAALTDRTKVVMPVHLGGAVADLDTILTAAAARRVAVVEDACQAHLAEWKGRKVGTYGRAGCFSFQASKNLNCAEGGAILTDDADLLESCYRFHNNSRGRAIAGSADFTYLGVGANLRMTEFQAAILLAQMTRLEQQAGRRDANGAYLTSLLASIAGITPARAYAGCTRNAYHLYMFRYDAAGFGGLTRAQFLKALSAEGIPASGGYSPLPKEPAIVDTLAGRAYRHIYGKAELDRLIERNQCPENERLCQQAIWLTQTMLLGPRTDMDQIADAIRKIQRHSADLRSL